MKTMRVAIAGLCAAVLVAAAGAWALLPGGSAGEGPAVVQAPVASAAAPAAPAAARDGTMRGGIGVRGHWTIEVRNPDGTVARRAEFDNALKDGGRVLVDHLTTHREALRWDITIGGYDPKVGIVGTRTMKEPDATHTLGTVDAFGTTWSVVVTRADVSGAPTVRLSANAIAVETASLTYVMAGLQACKDAGCPSGSGQTAGGALTQHDLETPVPVAAGQQVVVTVEISFQAV